MAEEAPVDVAAVPALIKALEDRDRQVWASAIQALARLGNDAVDAVPALLEQLRSSDRQRRYRTAYALGHVGTTRWERLRDGLKDGNQRQRLGIVQAFGWMRAAAAPVAEDLAELLGSDSEELAEAAANSLRQIGEPAVTSLTNAAKSESAEVRQRVATLFGQLDQSTSSTIESLRSLAHDDAPVVRAAALQALARVASTQPFVRELLIEALQAEQTAVQQAAATALLAVPDATPDAVEPLVALLDSGNDLATTAGYVLGRMGPRAQSAIPVLVARVAEQDDPRSAKALCRIGPSAIPSLLQATADHRLQPARAATIIGEMGPQAHSALTPELASSFPERRATAVRALGQFATEDRIVLAQILPAMEDPSSQVRVAAATALGQLKTAAADAKPLLSRAAMEDPDPQVRAQSLTALMAVGVPLDQLLPPVLKGLQDDSPAVRRGSAEALGHLQPFPAAAVGSLIAALDDPDATVRAGAAKALAAAGSDGKPAVPPLLQALTDPNNDVRRMAIRALGGIGAEAHPAVPKLLAQIGVATAEFPQETIEALGAIGPPAREALPALQEILDDDAAEIRAASLRAVAQIEESPDKLIPMLCHALDDADPSVRHVAAKQLGQLGADAAPAVPTLLRLLQREEDTATAAEALRQVDTAPPEAVPLLIEMLQNPELDRRSRYYALYLLRKAGPAAQSALPTLHRMLDDAEPRTRDMLERAIRELENRAGLGANPIAYRDGSKA